MIICHHQINDTTAFSTNTLHGLIFLKGKECGTHPISYHILYKHRVILSYEDDALSFFLR